LISLKDGMSIEDISRNKGPCGRNESPKLASSGAVSIVAIVNAFVKVSTRRDRCFRYE
jgi:hypothetical protein